MSHSLTTLWFPAGLTLTGDKSMHIRAYGRRYAPEGRAPERLDNMPRYYMRVTTPAGIDDPILANRFCSRVFSYNLREILENFDIEEDN